MFILTILAGHAGPWRRTWRRKERRKTEWSGGSGEGGSGEVLLELLETNACSCTFDCTCVWKFFTYVEICVWNLQDDEEEGIFDPTDFDHVGKDVSAADSTSELEMKKEVEEEASKDEVVEDRRKRRRRRRRTSSEEIAFCMGRAEYYVQRVDELQARRKAKEQETGEWGGKKKSKLPVFDVSYECNLCKFLMVIYWKDLFLRSITNIYFWLLAWLVFWLYLWSHSPCHLYPFWTCTWDLYLRACCTCALEDCTYGLHGLGFCTWGLVHVGLVLWHTWSMDSSCTWDFSTVLKRKFIKIDEKLMKIWCRFDALLMHFWCTFEKCIKSASKVHHGDALLMHFSKVHQKCIKSASKVHQKCIKFSSNLHQFSSKSVPTLHHKYKDVCVNHVAKLYQKVYANSIAQVHQNNLYSTS